MLSRLGVRGGAWRRVALLPFAASFVNIAPAEAEPRAPRVFAAVVIFRHGARAPVFRLTDADSSPPVRYETVSSAPEHSPKVHIIDAHHALDVGPPGSKGLLTSVGWEQGVALGRRLKAHYGRPSPPRVRSTDVSRTVLTAQAVLTGIYEGTEPPPELIIEVDRTQNMMVPTTCGPLVDSLNEGRRAHRQSDETARRAAALAAEAFGPLYDSRPCPMIAIHDDGIARRFSGHPPSRCVDVGLTDMASAEAAREVRSALAHGGDDSARLSAGRLCAYVAEHVRELLGERDPGCSHPPDVRLVLLSGHDTTLFSFLNALDREGEQVSRSHWPAYASSIVVELLDDGTARLLYQWQPLAIPGEKVGTVPVESLLQWLDKVSISAEEFAEASGGNLDAGVEGAVFRWSD